jgi:hypothetical protein
MDELDHAARILERLRTTLEAELVQARGQRLLIRNLDTQGLFERARQRSAFNVQLAQLEHALGETLETAGHTLGLAQVTLVDLGAPVVAAPGRVHGGGAWLGERPARDRRPEPEAGRARPWSRARLLGGAGSRIRGL